MSRLTRDGTAVPVSRDQILRHARGQGNINFPCTADHEQDWQPNPVDPYSAICDDHTYLHNLCATNQKPVPWVFIIVIRIGNPGDLTNQLTPTNTKPDTPTGRNKTYTTHSIYLLLSSYLSLEYFVLPSLLHCYSLNYLGRLLLNQHFLVDVCFSF